MSSGSYLQFNIHQFCFLNMQKISCRTFEQIDDVYIIHKHSKYENVVFYIMFGMSNYMFYRVNIITVIQNQIITFKFYSFKFAAWVSTQLLLHFNGQKENILYVKCNGRITQISRPSKRNFISSKET